MGNSCKSTEQLQEEHKSVATVDEAASTRECPPGAASYRFELEDPSWLGHLQTEGYCVLRRLASPEQAEAARALLWRDLEAAHGVTRGRPESWSGGWLPETGLLAKFSQSAGAWVVRGLPRVKAAFEQIWGTDELIVSMDTVLAWRPWSADERWRPHTEGLHLDQNPFSKPGLDCVQGMMPLLPVDERTGGLQVVPGSHSEPAKQTCRERYPHLATRGDWCLLDEADPAHAASLLLHAEPGDLILWDSRTVHGGLVGTGETDPHELARLSVCVAMTPRELASQEVQQLRRDGFRAGESFNHCPHEAGTSSGTIKRKLPKACLRAELSEAQLQLL